MAGIAASRRETGDPGISGGAAAGEAFGELASAAREVRAVTAQSGNGFMLGKALERLTEATAAAEELSRWKIAAEAVEEIAVARDGRLRIVR